MERGEKILWAPDRHLGRYIRESTGADMLLWDSACIVHEEFKARGLRDMRALYPDAAVLAHPESPAEVLAIADVVGSTTQIIKASQSLPNKQFIVATDRGIFHRHRCENRHPLFDVCLSDQALLFETSPSSLALLAPSPSLLGVQS